MIPYTALHLSSRHAKVLNGGLPTEKHGTEKKAFFDIKFECLVETAEIDTWLALPGDAPASTHIFDTADDSLPLNLPDIDLVGALREDIRGQLSLKVGSHNLAFDDAHTVGSVNKLTFMHGGRGRLVMQLRVDPGDATLPNLIEAIERGECALAFSESDESASAKNKNENQDEMAV